MNLTEELIKKIEISNTKVEICRLFGYNYCNKYAWKKIDAVIKSNGIELRNLGKCDYRRKYRREIKNCPICSKEFESIIGSDDERFTCSIKCASIFFAEKRGISIKKSVKTIKCRECGNIFDACGTVNINTIRCDDCKKIFKRKYKSKYQRKNTLIIKQKRKNRPKKIVSCISCGDSNSLKGKYCSECKKYVQNRILFGKMGVIGENLKLSNKLTLKILKSVYFDEKKSTSYIYKEYGIKENTLFFFFRKNGISLRNNTQSNKNYRDSLTQDELLLEMNRCHNNTYKCGYHTTFDNRQVFLRSSYEKIISQYLDELKIYYEVESLRIEYMYNNEVHDYIPDFFIPSKNMIIEAKGSYFYKKDKEKIDTKINTSIKMGYDTRLLISRDKKYVRKQIENIISMEL